MYKDLVSAFNTLQHPVKTADDLKKPVQKIGNVYETAYKQFMPAVQIQSDGSTKIDSTKLQNGLRSILSQNSAADIKRLTDAISPGFAMAGSDPIAPWSFFQDPASVSVLDDNAWKLLGFGPAVQVGTSGFQFGNFKNVPSAVKASPNLLMLEDEAKHPFAYTRGAALHRLNGIGPFHPENVPTPPTNGGVSSTGSALNTGSGQSPVSASDLQKLITCFTNSKWSMEWCGVICCLDSTCAQTIQTILWGGTAATLAAGVAAGIASFVASHAIGTAVSAALAVYGGWVGMAVLLSAFYWALMILLNMTPRGVCLHIPGPWTFGLLGPGWAVGV